MRRTQLYLEEDLWNVLHERSRSTGTTVSELVRSAVRERYLGDLQNRREAMRNFVGLRKDRPEFDDPEAYVRNLRGGTRLDRLNET